MNSDDREEYIRIDGVLTVYEASALRDKLLEKFMEKDELILDIGDVNDFDTIGIQLLCSALRTARENNKKFTIIGANECFREAVTRIGLNPENFAGTGEV